MRDRACGPLLTLALGLWFTACPGPESGTDGGKADGGAADSGGTDRGSADQDPAPEDFFLTLPHGVLSRTGSLPGVFPGLVGVLNIDDDNQNGTLDFDDLTISASENDLVLFSVTRRNHSLRFDLRGDTEEMRIWHDDQRRLGQGAATSWDLPAQDEVQLALELGFKTLAQAVLTVTSETTGDSVSLHLTAAPLILNHHLQTTERVWAIEVDYPDWDNLEMIDALRELLGQRLATYPSSRYDDDVWVQDEFELSHFTAPGARLNLVIDSIRNGELDPFPEDHLEGPDTVAFTFGRPRDATTFDSFGNLEVTPPHSAGGIDYPFGRVYYGFNGDEGLESALRQFLAEQQVQAPIALDTSWLIVGHVDEFMTFVPDPQAPRGFRLLYADTDLGFSLIDSMPPGTSLPRYTPAEDWGGHGISTVAGFTGNSALRSYNEDIQSLHLGPILQQLTLALELTSQEVVRTPAVYYEVSDGWYSAALALVPAMINLLLINNPDGTTAAAVGDPFLRSNLQDLASDPFIEAWNGLMPAGLQVRYVDEWDVYHLGWGGVHCGTNSLRTPGGTWWTSTTHLLTEEAL